MSLSSDTENEEDEVTVVRVKRKSQNVYEEIDLTEESDLASANDDPGYNPVTNANASNIPHYVPESETQKSSLPNGNQENNETVINETIREMINSFGPSIPILCKTKVKANLAETIPVLDSAPYKPDRQLLFTIVV